jgi:hypothetical protein
VEDPRREHASDPTGHPTDQLACAMAPAPTEAFFVVGRTDGRLAPRGGKPVSGETGVSSFFLRVSEREMTQISALKKDQRLACRESKTTKLYDRRDDELTLDEVERIAN